MNTITHAPHENDVITATSPSGTVITIRVGSATILDPNSTNPVLHVHELNTGDIYEFPTRGDGWMVNAIECSHAPNVQFTPSRTGECLRCAWSRRLTFPHIEEN